MAGSSPGTSSPGGPDVGFYPVGGGRAEAIYRPGIDYSYEVAPDFLSQPIVPVESPAVMELEMGDRSIEWGGDRFMDAEYPALYDIGVPPRPTVTPRDPKYDPTYFYSSQSAQMAPVLVDEAGSLPLPHAGQPLGMGGIPSPAEAMMLESLVGIVG